MMTPNLSPTDRRDAADQLGVPADASPADARAAFLRRLPAAGFVPAPPLCAAVASLAGQPVPGAVGVLDEVDGDDVLRAEVTAFGQQFWALRPDVRRGRWQDLLERAAADPRLAARLRRMEAGVDLRDATGVPGPPRQRELVGMIQTLFVLGPIERAGRRRELLDGLPPPAAGWEQAARRLQGDLPVHAALEPALVERLSTWSRRIAVAAAAADRPAPTWGFQTQGGLQMPQVRRPVRSAAGQRVPVWPAILAVIVIGRLISSLGSSSPSNSPRITPAYPLTPITRPSTPWTAPPTGRPISPEVESILSGKQGPPPTPVPTRGRP